MGGCKVGEVGGGGFVWGVSGLELQEGGAEGKVVAAKGKVQSTRVEVTQKKETEKYKGRQSH